MLRTLSIAASFVALTMGYTPAHADPTSLLTEAQLKSLLVGRTLSAVNSARQLYSITFQGDWLSRDKQGERGASI